MIKMHRIGFAITLAILSLGSCTPKELPEPTPANPVFSASGEADGQAFQMEAGKNNYVLKSSFNQNEFGVYEYESELTPEGCSNCGGTIRITITGHSALPASGAAYPDLSLRSGNYPYALNPMFSDEPNKLQFLADSYPGAVYQWSFGDGQFSFEPNPIHTYMNDNQHNATLVVSKDGYTSELIQRVKAGSPMPCSVYFDADYLGNSTWKFSDHNHWNHNDPEDHTWDINGQFAGEGYELTHQFPSNSNEVYKVGFRDLNVGPDCPDRFYKLVTAEPDTKPCLANFYAAPIPAPETLGTVHITYITSDGVVYDSQYDQNNAQNSYFIVDEAGEYGSTLDGYPTRKLNIRLKAKVERFGPSNEVIELDNVKLIMAFTYPE